MKVTAIIEKGKDGLYAIYMVDDLKDFGLNGTGKSVDEAKRDMLAAYAEIKEMLEAEGKEVPELEFVYRYDMPSFFDFFDWINISKFAERIGMNASLLRNYKRGAKFASEEQCRKITDGLRELADELSKAQI